MDSYPKFPLGIAVLSLGSTNLRQFTNSYIILRGNHPQIRNNLPLEASMSPICRITSPVLLSNDSLYHNSKAISTEFLLPNLHILHDSPFSLLRRKYSSSLSLKYPSKLGQAHPKSIIDIHSHFATSFAVTYSRHQHALL